MDLNECWLLNKNGVLTYMLTKECYHVHVHVKITFCKFVFRLKIFKLTHRLYAMSVLFNAHICFWNRMLNCLKFLSNIQGRPGGKTKYAYINCLKSQKKLVP